MKNRVIYTEDKIYVYLTKRLDKQELKKIREKINFIKAHYVINQTIMVHIWKRHYLWYYYYGGIMKYLKLLLIIMFFSINVKAYYEAPVDITKMDVYAVQDAIDKGYLTYELLVRLYLDRITAYDKNYKAIISINKNAIEEAKKCDLEYSEKGRSNILWCMPIIVKDNIDVKGLATTAGSKALSDSYPNEDAAVVKKLKEKGMIILAKANMSEFAFSSSSSKSYYGTVHNAYNLKYSAYGSSGGSAVAVASNYALFALGTDTNSSVRAPAAANNVIGFRPTLGLVDTKGVLAYDITRDAIGPITRTVKENMLLMETISSKEYKIPENSSLEGKNIVVIDQFLPSNSYSEIKTMFNNSVKKLEIAGANIIHLNNVYSSTYEYVGDSTMGGWTMCYAFNKYIKNTSSKIKSFYSLTFSGTNTYSLVDNYNKCNTSIEYTKTMENEKSSFRAHINNIIKKYNVDAFIYPNNVGKLLKIGESNGRGMSYKIAPVLGLPAVSVPLGFDSDGLPYGIEFMGAKNSEEKLYEIILEYEKLNNNYSLPSIAPSLYNIPEGVTKLKELYEAMLENDKSILDLLTLNKQKEKIRNFFLNYNNNENKTSEAGDIYEEIINKTAEEIYMNSIKSIKIVGFVYDQNTQRFREALGLTILKIIFYILMVYFLYMVLKSCRRKIIKKKSINY